MGVYASYRQHNQAKDFAELTDRARRRGHTDHETEALNALTRMVIVTGKTLRNLDLDDLVDYVAARKAGGRKVSSLPVAYELLRDIDGLKAAPPTWQQAHARGQLSVAELVDRYPVACRPIREVMVHYLDVEVAEDTAFWAWAVIEVLRRTGVRVEELLELTHLSLRRYQAPTGEMVALLQVSPSKTDAERVIPADPELVAVLARIIRRIKADHGRVRLLSRYDPYERVFGPPLPNLFQHISQRRLQVLSANKVRELLDRVVERAGIVDVDGTPLRFTPHDFRRIFSTETVNSGLPIHIAARLLGHLDLNTTQGYVGRVQRGRRAPLPGIPRPPSTGAVTGRI